MAESLAVPLPEITTDEFEHAWTRFELVAAAKRWDAAKQLAIVPALLRGKLLDYYVDLDAANKSSVATLKNALAQRAGLKKDSLAAAKAFVAASKFSNQPLTQDKLNTLRTKLSNLQLLIIDEISMVGSNMLLQIHKRLQQLKGKGDEATFGDVSILAVGDLFQLQPVAQPYVFAQVGDAYARLHRSGSLWRDEFELDEIMRQREDGQFVQLLCRVRTATCTEQDIDMLRSRGIKDEDPNYPHNSVHVYRLNVDVNEQNISKLKDLAPEDQHIVIRAIDCTKDKHTRQLDLAMPTSKANTGGLVTELHLEVGAKVMLTVNVDVSDGLVNGARGTVEAIIHMATTNEVSLVLVKFDHPRVGATAIAKSHYRDQHPGAVPNSRHEAVFNIRRNKTAEVSRRQFPLVLAWATTMHRVQGLTLHQIVVDMKGRAFSASQAYVAFSRVKSLEGLFIKTSIRLTSKSVHQLWLKWKDWLLTACPLSQYLRLWLFRNTTGSRVVI